MFEKHIERGAAYITRYRDSSNWIETIDIEKIHVRRFENENPLELTLGENEAANVMHLYGNDWLANNGFICARLEGDERPWAEIAKQLETEWREYIMNARELMEIAAQAY